VEVRRRMRSVQCSGGARAQCCQRLVLTQLVRDIRRSSVNGSESNGPKLEVDTLTDRQPVQLLLLQLSGTGTTWRLNNHAGDRILTR